MTHSEKSLHEGNPGESLPELNDRSQFLLKALVELYIRDGQPVGSRTLARETGGQLSAATIRNVMSDLEHLGLLHAPHTSAGRVPTARGYRCFVDSLLQVRPVSREEVDALRRQLDTEQGTPGLLTSASSVLSGITRMAGVVTVPRREHQTLRQVEFLPLSDNRVLAILVVNEQEVQNRIINTDRPYSAVELQQAANYLSAQFAGKDLRQVRESLVRDMRRTRERVDRMMRAAIDMAGKVFEPAERDDDDYVLAGQTNLMNFAELSDVQRLRQLFEAFTNKRDILHLFDQCISAQGVQIFIGEEAGFELMDDLSVVATPYAVGGQVLGVLGVIGPTRMAYARVIPIVEVTSRLLAAALNSRS